MQASTEREPAFHLPHVASGSDTGLPSANQQRPLWRQNCATPEEGFHAFLLASVLCFLHGRLRGLLGPPLAPGPRLAADDRQFWLLRQLEPLARPVDLYLHR